MSPPAQTADRLAAKAEAFGWKVVVVDGHNPRTLVNALKLRTEAMVAGKPLCIIAKTVKGWGAASQQGLGHHGHPVSEKDLAKVLAELDQTARIAGCQIRPARGRDQAVLRIHPPLHGPTRPRRARPATLAQVAEKAQAHARRCT